MKLTATRLLVLNMTLATGLSKKNPGNKQTPTEKPLKFYSQSLLVVPHKDLKMAPVEFHSEEA